MSSESCGNKWPLAISPEYTLLIWSYGSNYFWTGKWFYHDLIDYAQTRCCYYTASTYITCETLYPSTVFLFYSLRLEEEIWMPPSMHTFTGTALEVIIYNRLSNVVCAYLNTSPSSSLFFNKFYKLTFIYNLVIFIFCLSKYMYVVFTFINIFFLPLEHIL